MILARTLTSHERNKRGCSFCIYQVKATGIDAAETRTQKGERILGCAFSECPFHELDEFETYAEYERDFDRKFARLAEGIAGKYVEV